MTTYTVREDNHASTVIAVEEHQGFPVLIHEVGHYPSLLDEAGAKVERLIEVGRHSYGWTVKGVAGWRNGRLMSQRVGAAESLEEARSLFDAAAQAIEAAPGLYERAGELARQYAHGPLSRAEYERLADQLGFGRRPDEDLSEWGDFSFPQYSLDKLPKLWIEQRRAYTFRTEKKARFEAMRQAQAAADQSLAEVLRSRPVARVETKLVWYFPDEHLQGGALYTVIQREPHTITGDDPSIYGSYLLGHEGERGEIVTVEVRTA